MKDLEIRYVKEEKDKNKTNRANLILTYRILEIRIVPSAIYGYSNDVKTLFSTDYEERFKKVLKGILKDRFRLIQTYITDDCELIAEVYKAD